MVIISGEREKVTGGRVAEVKMGGLAERLGIKAGDIVVGVNGMPVRDVLDVMYHCASDGVEGIEIERDGRRFTLHEALDAELDEEIDDELGLEFENWTFDGIKRCHNRCLFCFVDQLPSGMRQSLYVKDDDYRYSVLCGNFVTLTNLTGDDWARLEEQRPGPLRVSVHSTDRELRRLLLGNPKAPDIIEQLKRLGRLRIAVHAQVVLVPGTNDGQHLEKTVEDLATLYPTVRSVAVVPVGRTGHASPHAATLREFTREESCALVDRVAVWQRGFRKKLGFGLVYLADELYLRAGRRVPSARSYDGFPQYENGVGMVRSLLDDWARVRRKLMSDRGKSDTEGGQRQATIVCGTAIASVMGEIVDGLAEVSGLRARLLPIENAFFGSTVTVSGLLTGGDVLKALRGRDLGDVVILPRAMLDSKGELTLDDESPESLGRKLGMPVEFAGTVSDMVRLWSQP